MNISCTLKRGLVSSLALVMLSPAALFAQSGRGIKLQPIGTYATGIFDGSAAEIVAHDPNTQRLFVVNVAQARIDVLDISDPTAPTLVFFIDITPYGKQPNSVDVSQGTVVVAVEANQQTDPGKAVFFDTDGNLLSSVIVGALPDMITFTPDSKKVLVANEAQPDDSYTIDPEGSVSIIDLTRGAAGLTQADVFTAGFTSFNGQPLDPSVRIFGPGASVAQDLEPEYIAVSHDSKTAWVTLQENNALAILDIEARKFTKIVGLGFKNHMQRRNGLDASDRDGAINIRNWPVFGMYQPDAIASYIYQGQTYLITANEGDARDYSGFSEEERVKDLILDPLSFPNASELQMDSRLGRLNVTSATGDTDGDGDFDQLYAFGARSFSVRSASGALVFDSKDQFERITANAFPNYFNSDNTSNSFDNRSDNKGPEPEGVTVGDLFGRTYAFIGLERIGGIMVYDVTNPTEPRFVQYINNRNFAGDPATGTAGDLGPEGLIFIPAQESPINRPLLVVANEVSGTTTIYEVQK